jgi:hypothetical protein
MFVSVTRLRIRRLWDMPAFAVQALRSALQAKNAKGNVSVALLAEARRTFSSLNGTRRSPTSTPGARLL